VPADECHLPARRRLVSRQRINDNLPGTADFCPLVRRTPALAASAAARLDDRCRGLTRARNERYCDPGRLVAAQNEIVDPRFQ
jgi:hypothetical protein